MSYAVHRWWARVAQIRSAMDQSCNFHEANAASIERAVDEAYSDACSPWFDSRAYLANGRQIDPIESYVATPVGTVSQ